MPPPEFCAALAMKRINEVEAARTMRNAGAAGYPRTDSENRAYAALAGGSASTE